MIIRLPQWIVFVEFRHGHMIRINPIVNPFNRCRFETGHKREMDLGWRWNCGGVGMCVGCRDARPCVSTIPSVHFDLSNITIVCKWSGIKTNAPKNNSSRNSNDLKNSSYTICPISFNTISPSLISPNNLLRPAVTMVM